MDLPLKSIDPLQRAAAGACLGMLALLALFQFAITPESRAPPGLYVIFSFVWLFGAFMLFLSPRFGAAGTALWGVISAVGAWQTHARAASWENLVLIAGSLLASALAVGFLVRARGRRIATAA